MSVRDEGEELVLVLVLLPLARGGARIGESASLAAGGGEQMCVRGFLVRVACWVSLFWAREGVPVVRS